MIILLTSFFGEVVSQAIGIVTFMLALGLVMFIVAVIPKHNPFKRIDKRYLEKYLEKCIERERYQEARYVQHLLDKNKHNNKIRLPRRYVYIEKTKFKEDINSVWGIKRTVRGYIKIRFPQKEYNWNVKKEKKKFNLLESIGMTSAIIMTVTGIIALLAQYLHINITPRVTASAADSIPVNLETYLQLGFQLRIGQQIINEKRELILIENTDLLEKYFYRKGDENSNSELLIKWMEKEVMDKRLLNFHPVFVNEYRRLGFLVKPGMKIINPYTREVELVTDNTYANQLNKKYVNMDKEFIEHANKLGIKPEPVKVVLDSTDYSNFRKKRARNSKE